MKKINILLADDVDGWLNFHKKNLAEIFENYEFNLYSFPSAHSAYDFAFQFDEKIDIVITDMEMESVEEGYAGEWLIDKLKSLSATRFSKYFIISSAPMISLIKDRTGANGCLRKASYNSNPSLLKYMLEESLGEI